MVLDNIFNPVFGPVMKLPEPFALMVISFILTLITTLIYKYATDQELMKSMKEEMKLLKEESKKFREDPKKMMEINKQMWEKSMKQMSQSWKPMLFTFIPVIFIFSWLRAYYTALGNPAVFFGLSWIWSYIIFSLVFNLALRKLLRVH